MMEDLFKTAVAAMDQKGYEGLVDGSIGPAAGLLHMQTAVRYQVSTAGPQGSFVSDGW